MLHESLSCNTETPCGGLQHSFHSVPVTPSWKNVKKQHRKVAEPHRWIRPRTRDYTNQLQQICSGSQPNTVGITKVPGSLSFSSASTIYVSLQVALHRSMIKSTGAVISSEWQFLKNSSFTVKMGYLRSFLPFNT